MSKNSTLDARFSDYDANFFDDSFKLLLNAVHSNYCKRVCLFYANFSLDNFALFF